MKDDLVIRGGEQVRSQQQVTGTETQTGGTSHPNSVNGQPVNNQGKGTEVQSETNINVYGQDVANFAHFKKDANDAMSITNSAATRVKIALMGLKHDYPDVQVNLEPMPSPAQYGKKREGFINYKQALTEWESLANEAIRLAKEDAKRNYASGSATSSTSTPNPVKDEPEKDIDKSQKKDEPHATPSKPRHNPFDKRVRGGGSRKNGDVNDDSSRTSAEGSGKTSPKQPKARFNNFHYRGREVLEASEGVGTDEERFLTNVTVGNPKTDKSVFTRQDMNATEAKALDEEIRKQTGGKSNLLKLMREEFSIGGGTGYDQYDARITELYRKYVSYGLKED